MSAHIFEGSGDETGRDPLAFEPGRDFGVYECDDIALRAIRRDRRSLVNLQFIARSSLVIAHDHVQYPSPSIELMREC